jgi:hypothetical protein
MVVADPAGPCFAVGRTSIAANIGDEIQLGATIEGNFNLADLWQRQSGIINTQWSKDGQLIGTDLPRQFLAGMTTASSHAIAEETAAIAAGARSTVTKSIAPTHLH